GQCGDVQIVMFQTTQNTLLVVGRKSKRPAPLSTCDNKSRRSRIVAFANLKPCVSPANIGLYSDIVCTFYPTLASSILDWNIKYLSVFVGQLDLYTVIAFSITLYAKYL